MVTAPFGDLPGVERAIRARRRLDNAVDGMAFKHGQRGGVADGRAVVHDIDAAGRPLGEDLARKLFGTHRVRHRVRRPRQRLLVQPRVERVDALDRHLVGASQPLRRPGVNRRTKKFIRRYGSGGGFTRRYSCTARSSGRFASDRARCSSTARTCSLRSGANASSSFVKSSKSRGVPIEFVIDLPDLCNPCVLRRERARLDGGRLLLGQRPDRGVDVLPDGVIVLTQLPPCPGLPGSAALFAHGRRDAFLERHEVAERHLFRQGADRLCDGLRLAGQGLRQRRSFAGDFGVRLAEIARGAD